MPVQVVHEHGSFDGDCDHIQMADSAWHRLGSQPRSGGGGGPSPVPNATFAKLAIAAGETVTLKVALAVGVACCCWAHRRCTTGRGRSPHRKKHRKSRGRVRGAPAIA